MECKDVTTKAAEISEIKRFIRINGRFLARDPLIKHIGGPNKMNRKPTRSFRAALLVSLAVALVPAAARAQSEPVDLTAMFRSAGADITDLRVYQISDIILIRGTTADRGKAENASRLARNLGYQRVANLINVVEPIADVNIVRSAEGSLGRQRALDGCKFHIDSLNGIVRIGGSVDRELQKDVAVELLRRIDGVKEVHSTLRVL